MAISVQQISSCQLAISGVTTASSSRFFASKQHPVPWLSSITAQMGSLLCSCFRTYGQTGETLSLFTPMQISSLRTGGKTWRGKRGGCVLHDSIQRSVRLSLSLSLSLSLCSIPLPKHAAASLSTKLLCNACDDLVTPTSPPSPFLPCFNFPYKSHG